MEYIISKEEYLCTIAAWNKIANRNSADHIFYNALRGLDLKRGFSPIKENSPKLANGAQPWQAFTQAKSNAYWALRETAAWHNELPERTARREAENKERTESLSKKFGVTFTPELITTLRELLK